MKRINYLALAAAGLLMASCSQEDLQGPGANVDGNYVVTVKLPADLTTRAVNMNTGLTANNLDYAVYDVDGVLVETGKTVFTEEASGALQTKVGFNLASGKDYRISFFASAPENGVYTFNAKDQRLTVDYSAMTSDGNSQEDLYDCFINLLPTGVIGTENVQTSVTLYRPVAQINWGTNDYTVESIKKYYGDNLQYLQSALTTTAYTTFDLFNNDVITEETEEVTLAEFTVPVGANGEAVGFPVGGYKYVGMEYLLAPKSETLFDLNLAINNAVENDAVEGNTFEGTITNAVAVSNAPVQANYRTNIYGALLTDNVEITVVKSPDWGGNYMLPQGEGEAISGAPDGITYNEATNTYYITTPAGLEYYAENVGVASVGNTGLAGTTVIIADDLDMSEYNGNHTPFYLGGATIDGQGHTISNLKVVATEQGNAGFVGYGVGYIQNLNFTDANIQGNFMAGVVVGNGIATRINNVSVSNSTVISTPWSADGSVYDDGNNAGAIVGYLSAEGTAEVTNCYVDGCTVTAYRKVGGAVGMGNGAVKIENNRVSNTTVTANQKLPKGTYVKEYPFLAGEIAGGWSDSATVSGNIPEQVSVITINSEGVMEATVNSTSALASAVGIATEGAVINVEKGTYTFPAPSAFTANGIVIDCEEGTTFVGRNNWLVYSGSNYGLRGAIIKNATFSNPGGNVIEGYLTGSFENCVFEGSNAFRNTYIAAPEVNFTGCTFIGNGVYALHIDSTGAAAGSTPKVNFTNCNFSGFVAVGKGKVISYYFTGCEFSVNPNSTYGGGNFYGDDYFTNCTFNIPPYNGDDTTFQWIDLNAIDVVYDFTNCYISGGVKLTGTNYKFRTTQDGVTATIDGVKYDLPNNK